MDETVEAREQFLMASDFAKKLSDQLKVQVENNLTLHEKVLALQMKNNLARNEALALENQAMTLEKQRLDKKVEKAKNEQLLHRELLAVGEANRVFLQGQERAAATEGALFVCLNTHVSAFLFSSNYELRVIFIYIMNLGIFEYEPLFYVALFYLMLLSYCTSVEHLKCALWTRSGQGRVDTNCPCQHSNRNIDMNWTLTCTLCVVT